MTFHGEREIWDGAQLEQPRILRDDAKTKFVTSTLQGFYHRRRKAFAAQSLFMLTEAPRPLNYRPFLNCLVR
jgi:hypothetical protein